MNEERQAGLLAQWLEDPSGRAAPEGIDADVLETIYVLRPERAPAPAVSIEDILTTAGKPWSEDDGPTTDPIGFEPEEPTAQIPSARPAFGGSEQTPIEAAKVIPFRPTPPRDRPSEFPALDTEEPTPPPQRVAPRRPAWRPWAYGGGGLAAAAALLFGVMGPLSHLDQAPDAPSAEPIAQERARPAEEKNALTGATADDESPDAVADTERSAGDIAAGAAVGRGDVSNSARRGELAAAKAEQSPMISADALAALRAAARPQDYENTWYLAADLDEATQSRITQTLNKVSTDTRYDDYDAASRTCELLIDEPDVRVGQDFAYRAARYARQAGSSTRALALIERGIERGSANTFLLSMLHYTKGELLSQTGDTDGAAAAYEAAKNLNAARR